jgi:hypothetical protein
MGTTAFTPEDKGDVKIVKYSVTRTDAGTFVLLNLNDGGEDVSIFSVGQIGNEEIEIMILELNSMENIRSFVRFPDCEQGATIAHEPVGTNFVKNTCASIGGGHGEVHDECFAYSPYTHSWNSVACWPS